MVLTDDDEMVSIPRMDMARPVQPTYDPELEALREAYKRVANFPESDPQGWARMMDLRKAVEKYLETR